MFPPGAVGEPGLGGNALGVFGAEKQMPSIAPWVLEDKRPGLGWARAVPVAPGRGQERMSPGASQKCLGLYVVLGPSTPRNSGYPMGQWPGV